VPNHDLVAVWEEHLRSEFVAHDADAAMDTMAPTRIGAEVRRLSE
jgi:hypothetical protein